MLSSGQRLGEVQELEPGLLWSGMSGPESLGFLSPMGSAVDSSLYGGKVVVRTHFPGIMCFLASGHGSRLPGLFKDSIYL